MNRAALLRRIRRALLLPTGKRHRSWRETRRARATRDQQWSDEIREMLPPTPPAEPEPAEAWAPRITRWIRVTFPLPDDTILLPLGTGDMVLELMARGCAWDLNRRTQCVSS